MTLRRLRWDRIGYIALLVMVVLIVAACSAPGGPGASGSVHPSATPHPPLEPAQPGADPISFLAWLFTPIFKAMFIVLVGVYDLLRGWASRRPSAGRSWRSRSWSGRSSSRSTGAS